MLVDRDFSFPAQHMFSIIPKDDPKQALIISRFLMAFGSYLMAIVFGLIAVVNGNTIIRPELIPIIIGGVILSNIYFYVVFRSGANKKYPDSSLTTRQIVVAMVWLLVIIFGDSENRGLFISIYALAMVFGIFQLQRRQMAKIAVFGFLSYCLIVAIDYFYFPFRFDLARESIRASILFGLLLWVTLFAGHIAELRSKLRRRNRDLSAALQEIGKLAKTDDLTKAYNRRYIMDSLSQEKLRCDRTSSTFSVCILDLDRFKTINDRYGHLAGDRVLMAFCERIRGALRGMDLVDNYSENRFFGRYGGEEFIVVLPETHLAGAMRCAERIRRVTEEASFDEVFNVTLSAGVCQYKAGETIEETLRRADGALYEAKDRGRNRIVADDNSALEEYEMAIGDRTKTNIIVGNFLAKKP